MREELRDPWGWLVALGAVGLAWALGIQPPIAVLIGLAVFGTKVLWAVVFPPQTRAVAGRTGDALPAPPRRSEAALLVARAEAAQAGMARLADLPADPWLRGEVGRMDDGADEVVAAMRDLAGRVTLAEQLLVSARGDQLQADRAALLSHLQHTDDPALALERRRALDAVDGQLAGLTRLSGLRDQLLARMQTAAVGMETIATRMGEVVTLGTAAMEHDRATEVIGDAGNDLEALRTGLAEAQQLARGVGPL